MSQTPDDLSLPSHDAGVLFRAEMAAQNFVLGYWKAIVGAVVFGLLLILIYGQYTGWVKSHQQGYAADIAKAEVRIAELLPTLAFDPTLVTPEDTEKIAEAAAALVAVGDSASGPAAAEAYMKAGEIFRLLGQTEAQLDAYDKAIPHAQGDVAFAAASARAATLLETGATDASIAAWQSLSQQHVGFLGAWSTLQLARTQRVAGDIPAATASFDAMMARFPDSPLAEVASDERSRLSSVAPVGAPAPTIPPAPSEPAPSDEPAPADL